MPKTKSRRGSYTMRFCRFGGQVVAFSEFNSYVGGEGKKRRVRVFTESGPVMDVPVHEFQAMVQDDTIRRLDLPHSLKEKAEVLSDEIGDAYTPQEALYVLQQMIQEHPTTLETAGVRVR